MALRGRQRQRDEGSQASHCFVLLQTPLLGMVHFSPVPGCLLRPLLEAKRPTSHHFLRTQRPTPPGLKGFLHLINAVSASGTVTAAV